jgi:mono/diheme cytochrome c family protein
MKKLQSLTVMCMLFLSIGIMSYSKTLSLQQSKLQASIARGQIVYTARCLTCHQVDGGGVSRMNPPLINTKWVLGEKPQLIQIILKGMTTGVEIDNKQYHNVMASHKDLSDLQIADVLTYVRNSFGNKAKAVTEAEVKTERAKL